jgi:hypothetical protein
MMALLPENRGQGKASAFFRDKFYAFFCWFPCMTALLLGTVRFLFPDLDGRKASLLLVFIFLCLCSIIIWLVREPQNRGGKRWRWLYMPMAVFAAAAVVRILWVIQTGPSIEPFSDFDWAYQAALGSREFIQHHATFPSWGLYAGLLRLIIQVVGPVFTGIQLFNAVTNSVSAVLVYYIALMVTDQFRTASVAGLLFGFMPSSILYTNILSPEIPSLMLILSVVLLMLVTFKYKLRLWVRILIWIGIGLVCAVANYLKAVGIILLIAFAITQFIFLNRQNMNRQPSGEPSSLFRSVAGVLLSLALIAAPFYLVGRAIDRSVENKLGVPINHSQMSHFLFVGLNTKGEGQIHIGEYNHKDLKFLADHGYDYELTDQWVKDFLERDWSENYEDIPGLFAKKAQWAWQDDIIPAYYTEKQAAQSGLDERWLNAINRYGFSLSQAYYVALALLAALGICVIRKRDADNRGFFILCMYVFGFALMLLISEAQSRYKCMITPVMCILAAVGLAAIIDSIKARIRNRKKSDLKLG